VLCSGLSPAQESHAVWKNAIGKTGVPVFLIVYLAFFDYGVRGRDFGVERPAVGYHIFGFRKKVGFLRERRFPSPTVKNSAFLQHFGQ